MFFRISEFNGEYAAPAFNIPNIAINIFSDF